MGLNPFKAAKKAVKGITKPFKKVLRSPIGKAALMYATWKFGPKAFGATDLGGSGGWGQAAAKLPPWLVGGTETTEGVSGILHQKTTPSLLGRFKNMSPLAKAATIGGATMAVGAMGDDVLEESTTVVDDSGHRGYLNARKGFVDEWTQWLIDQGHDEDTARAMAEKELFAKAEGGVVGLAQGGRIGLYPGGVPGGGDKGMMGTGDSYGDSYGPGRNPNPHEGLGAKDPFKGAPPGLRSDPTHTPKGPKSLGEKFTDWKTNQMLSFVNRNKYKNLKAVNPNLVGPTKGWKGFFNPSAEVEDYDVDSIREIAATNPGLTTSQVKGLKGFRNDLEAEKGIKADPTQTTFESFYNLNTTTPPGGEGPQAEWRRLGYPSHAAYLAAMQGSGGGGGTGTGGVGDYYGFKEWEDWAGDTTTPLFGDATQYKALLNKGGRIGLYAGGMGAMNNSMNPMMNQGLGAMGSPGMNPYNQQNLMAQGQMRAQPGGMPQGRPMMPGQGAQPMGQGPGLASLQSAKLPKQNEDNELLKLIRMLASLGIPMEQLRGRTKEELVEMVIAVQSRTQPEGRPEVVEESEEVEEEVMTAAGGGRVHAAGGLGETRGNPAVVGEIEDAREFMISNQGIEDVADYAGEYEQDEEEEIYIPQEKNPFERQGMEFDKPVGREGTFRADNPPVMYSLNKGGLMRTAYAMGTEQPVIPSKDGSQLDFRNIGGYQPHGKKEKHDDVRALLAQGEFVVTSDAVKGIGEGDRDLGAKRMYDMMHKYEPIGRALS